MDQGESQNRNATRKKNDNYLAMIHIAIARMVLNWYEVIESRVLTRRSQPFLDFK